MNMFKRARGFTLFEILIALFIFTIVALIMTQALHNIFNISATTQAHSARLSKLQIALLLIDRDLQQYIDRPITNNQATVEPSFLGTSQGIIFTHGGLSNPHAAENRSTLQRTAYIIDKSHFMRKTWDVLDQVATTNFTTRELMTEVNGIEFEFLDDKNNWLHQWPPPNQTKQAPPRAVRMKLLLNHWGELSHVYPLLGKSLNVH